VGEYLGHEFCSAQRAKAQKAGDCAATGTKGSDLSSTVDADRGGWLLGVTP